METRLKRLIEELVQIPGPSGQEELVAEYLQEQFKPFADEAWIDKSGNSIAKFNGTSGCVIVVTAHMDEVFTVVERVKDGLVYVKIGCSMDPENLAGVPVEVLTESGKRIRGIYGSSTIHLKKWEKPCELFVDTGGEVDGILPGDPVTYAPNLFWMNDHVVASKALDDRLACAILVQLAERFAVERPKDTVYLVGTRMEEIRMHGGASYIAKTIPADYYISIDTNYGYDPRLPENKSWNIGDGPVIRRWERSTGAFTFCFSSRELTQALGKAGEELGVPFGYDIADTFTDSSGIYVERPDAKVCGINVARRYSHSAHEVVDVRDVAGCRDIVYTAIQKYI